jgi:hypothetical protein
MRARKVAWLRLWIAAALLLLLLSVAACTDVQVVDTTPFAAAPEAFTSPLQEGEDRHNLAVLAVEFDPPLDYQQLIILRQPVALLVVIENTGRATERDVTVRAELTSPEDPDLLLTQGASVSSIAPGEIQLVRFARLGEIPYHETYHLEVFVDPVDGETGLTDNRKAFDIEIQPR